MIVFRPTPPSAPFFVPADVLATHNTKPTLEEEKKAGLISDYKTFTNPAIDHPGDWDVALSISYPNYAALDQLAAKGATIAKHFGSRDAALERAKKLNDVVEVIASHLAREVIPK